MTNKESIKKLLMIIGCLIISVLIWLYVVGVENPIDNIDLRKLPVNIINQDVLEGRNLYNC
jgi:uncharacterized membrane protein (Fun14 family)